MKKSIIPVAAFIAGMAIVPSVFAAEGVTKTDIESGGTLRECLAATDKNATCVLKDGFTWTPTEEGQTIDITKAMVLDLNGKKLTIAAGAQKTPFDIKENGSLTIVNGTIENLSAKKINVGKNGSLTIDANVKSSVVAGEASHIVLSAGRTLEGSLEVNGGTDYTVFGAGAADVEINGHIDGYYSQADNVNATINGSITFAGDAVKVANKGSLTLNGARINATAGSAVVLNGNDGNITVKGCSELAATAAAGAAMYINAGADVASLTISNSTLKNTAGSVINGAGKIETVTIDGSRFEAKGETTAVKAGTTTFTHATYDGTVIGDEENVLQDAKGTYGDVVTCDASATDEGEEEGAENPNTADTIATYLTIATVALLGLGATAFVAKKSNR